MQKTPWWNIFGLYGITDNGWLFMNENQSILFIRFDVDHLFQSMYLFLSLCMFSFFFVFLSIVCVVDIFSTFIHSNVDSTHWSHMWMRKLAFDWITFYSCVRLINSMLSAQCVYLVFGTWLTWNGCCRKFISAQIVPFICSFRFNSLLQFFMTFVAIVQLLDCP